MFARLVQGDPADVEILVEDIDYWKDTLKYEVEMDNFKADMHRHKYNTLEDKDSIIVLVVFLVLILLAVLFCYCKYKQYKKRLAAVAEVINNASGTKVEAKTVNV